MKMIKSVWKWVKYNYFMYMAGDLYEKAYEQFLESSYPPDFQLIRKLHEMAKKYYDKAQAELEK